MGLRFPSEAQKLGRLRDLELQLLSEAYLVGVEFDPRVSLTEA